MSKNELIRLFNEITLSKSYNLEEKIRATNSILKAIKELDKNN